MEDKQAAIAQIREFNRFYTVLLGFLDRNYLDSGYSVTETRILFELHQNRPISANQLIDMLRLDKSYISRIIRRFEQGGLVTRSALPQDRRTLLIHLTPRGLEEAEQLIARTNQSLSRLVEPLSPQACAGLCQAMQTITALFSDRHPIQEDRHES